MSQDSIERLGQAIDRVENLEYALKMQLPADMHVDQMRSILPEIVSELKQQFTAVTGENPWD